LPTSTGIRIRTMLSAFARLRYLGGLTRMAIPAFLFFALLAPCARAKDPDRVEWSADWPKFRATEGITTVGAEEAEVVRRPGKACVEGTQYKRSCREGTSRVERQPRRKCRLRRAFEARVLDRSLDCFEPAFGPARASVVPDGQLDAVTNEWSELRQVEFGRGEDGADVDRRHGAERITCLPQRLAGRPHTRRGHSKAICARSRAGLALELRPEANSSASVIQCHLASLQSDRYKRTSVRKPMNCHGLLGAIYGSIRPRQRS
jgi:hypothetical protein